MKRILSSWQGLTSGVLALTVYLFLPPVLRWYDPTAGAFDAGYLQWLGLGVVLFFAMIFFGWVGFQIAFRSLDRMFDINSRKWEKELSGRELWYATQAFFFLMLVLFLCCLRLVPL